MRGYGVGLLLSCLAALTFAATVGANAQTPPAARAAGPSDSTRALIAAATFPFSIENGRPSLAGGERLVAEARDVQFVMVAEEHNDLQTPALVVALFRALQEAHGFDYLALEQDPLGMEMMSREPRRGDLTRLGQWARSYPRQVTFATDAEMEMIAQAGQISEGRWLPVWGADQAFGATVYLEELSALAPNAASAALVDELLAEARPVEGPTAIDQPHFMSANAVDNLRRFQALRAVFDPRPGSRSDRLLTDLIKSAEIYSYYQRAAAGDADVSLLNNTAREENIRRAFLDNYRHAEAADGRLPRVVMKYGHWHVRRGRSPGNAWNLGTFANELAASNRMAAITINAAPLGGPSADHYRQFANRSPIGRTLLPGDEPPSTWLLVDLRQLRARWIADAASFGLPAENQPGFDALLFGYDYVLYMPDGRRSPTTIINRR